jgi:tetratricopeptide (TPR) repeat protein
VLSVLPACRFTLLLLALLGLNCHGTFAQEHYDAGLKAFQGGALERAVASWTEAARSAQSMGRSAEQITALEHLARAYVSLGRYALAVQALDAALQVARETFDDSRLSSLLAALGNAHIAVGPPETAEAYLRKGLDLARREQDTHRIAAILNDLGNLHAAQQRFGEAIAQYRESAALARTAGLRVLAARALANGASAMHTQGAAH